MVLYIYIYIYVSATQFVSPPSFPYCAYKSILYISASISALQIGLSVLFFYIPNIYINMHKGPPTLDTQWTSSRCRLFLP